MEDRFPRHDVKITPVTELSARIVRLVATMTVTLGTACFTGTLWLVLNPPVLPH